MLLDQAVADGRGGGEEEAIEGRDVVRGRLRAASEACRPIGRSHARDQRPGRSRSPSRSSAPARPRTSAAFVRLREEVIEREMPQVPRERGLLRRAMLEALLRHRPTDEREFRERVPLALRQGTDPEQLRRYADRVFALLAELG